jgi:hypothetical protein
MGVPFIPHFPLPLPKPFPLDDPPDIHTQTKPNTRLKWVATHPALRMYRQPEILHCGMNGPEKATRYHWKAYFEWHWKSLDSITEKPIWKQTEITILSQTEKPIWKLS